MHVAWLRLRLPVCARVCARHDSECGRINGTYSVGILTTNCAGELKETNTQHEVLALASDSGPSSPHGCDRF